MARILIIEDEAQIRENLMRFLRLEGHDVAFAADGVAGLALLRSAPPELVICDFMMPRMDGKALLKHLRDSGSVIPSLVLLAAPFPTLRPWGDFARAIEGAG